MNEEWLADKSRFSYDGLKTQRLAFPMVKDNSGEMKAVEWADTLSVAAEVLNNANGQVSMILYKGRVEGKNNLPPKYYSFLRKLIFEIFFSFYLDSNLYF